MGHHQPALMALDRAIALGPSSADMRALHALVLNFFGRPVEGLEDIELAVRLNPIHPDWYVPILGRSFYLLGRHDEAVAILQRLARSRTELLPMPSALLMVANLVPVDRLNEARELMGALRGLRPDFTAVQAPRYAPYKNRQDYLRFLDLLHQAGLPK